eukprot:TRINITY_DN33540_c0_g1_i1.p1 TRINITY_DN33540_c0_g1~~TRINITY_DN33540_c0_g1_i1.p1  ORF type:complete len:155 (-),score=19.65 TRINITY_DN33540_c0_g1_i1:43-507(-)
MKTSCHVHGKRNNSVTKAMQLLCKQPALARKIVMIRPHGTLEAEEHLVVVGQNQWFWIVERVSDSEGVRIELLKRDASNVNRPACGSPALWRWFDGNLTDDEADANSADDGEPWVPPFVQLHGLSREQRELGRQAAPAKPTIHKMLRSRSRSPR